MSKISRLVTGERERNLGYGYCQGKAFPVPQLGISDANLGPMVAK